MSRGIPSRRDLTHNPRIAPVETRVPSRHPVLGGEPDGILGLLLNLKSEGDVRFSVNTSFAVTQDRGPVLRRYGNMTVDAGVTVTTANRCKGLVMLVEGDLTVHGTISMTGQGAYAHAGDVRTGEGAKWGDAWVLTRADLGKLQTHLQAGVSPEADNWLGVRAAEDDDLTDLVLSQAVGAAGGVYVQKINSGVAGNTGSAGSNNQCGGGGAGGCYGYQASGVATTKSGAAGTAFSGGPGSGGCGANNAAVTNTSTSSAIGGPGGDGATNAAAYAGGGAGNGGGIGSYNGGPSATYNGSDGTGGLIILIVLGRVHVSASGVIAADGAAGGSVPTGGVTTGGGGSGGGNVQILYGRGYTNLGTVRANGGSGGTGQYAGGAGGAGSVRTTALSTLM